MGTLGSEFMFKLGNENVAPPLEACRTDFTILSAAVTRSGRTRQQCIKIVSPTCIVACSMANLWMDTQASCAYRHR
jgi:hypothetical protein